jgi:hypothetical protein
MATGLKGWLGAVLLGMASIVVWVFPIDREGPAKQQHPPEVEHWGALLSDIALEREHLRRLTWLDSMTSALDANQSTPKVVMLVPASADAEAYEAFEGRLMDELGHFGERRADFGVFLTAPSKPSPKPPYYPGWDHEHDEYYVGSHAGRAYCFVARLSANPTRALRNGGWGGSRIFGPESILGPCGYVLRYGLPGPFLSEWLKTGSFSRGMNPPRRTVSRTAVRRDDDGRWKAKMVGGSLAGHSCVRREVSSCATIFLAPKATEEGVALQLTAAVPELWEVAGVHTNHLQYIDNQMFAELEAEFGQDRFARFWSSGKTAPEAFEEAFGVAPGVWVQAWARGYYLSGVAASDRVEAAALAVVLLLGSFVSVLRTVRRRSVA